MVVLRADEQHDHQAARRGGRTHRYGLCVFSSCTGTTTPSIHVVESGYSASGVKTQAPGSEKAASQTLVYGVPLGPSVTLMLELPKAGPGGGDV